MTDTGRRIKEVRTHHLKLSQEEFGRKIGLSKHVVYNIENRNNQPRQELIELISVTYGISADYLQTGNGPVRTGDDSDKLREIEGIFSQLNEQNRAIIHAQMQAMLEMQRELGHEPKPDASAQ